MKRIQIIGTQRSGSNLLRVMLNQHERICAPHPPHLLKTFKPLLERYGSLEVRENFLSLALDMIKWVELNPVQWQGFTPTALEIIDRCESPTVYQLFKAIYDWEAERFGKQVWVCKSMSNYEFADQFELEGIFDHYIFLYRDGRDVALSFSKAIVGPKLPFFCATQWNQDQIESLKLKNKLGAKVYALSYESLIQQPDFELEKLFEALGLQKPDDVLSYSSSIESVVTAGAGDMWKNVARPVIAGNMSKYVAEMTLLDQQVYESVAGSTLHALGYPVNFWPGNILSFSSDELEEMTEEEKFLRRQAQAQASTHDLNLRKAQSEFYVQLAGRKVS